MQAAKSILVTLMLITGTGEAAERVSLIRLLANPDLFQKQEVILEGVYCAEQEGIGLYVSVFACENQLTDYGVGLALGEIYFAQREKYRHKKPMIIQGVVSVPPKNQIVLDALNFPVKILNVKFHWEYYKDRAVVPLRDEKKFDAIMLLVKNWKDSVRSKKHDEIAVLMGFYEEELYGSDVNRVFEDARFKWVMFDAPGAVSKILDTLVEESIFVAYEDGDEYIYVCLQRNRTLFSSEKEMPAPLESHNGFCFEVFDWGPETGYVISPVDFGYY